MRFCFQNMQIVKRLSWRNCESETGSLHIVGKINYVILQLWSVGHVVGVLEICFNSISV